MLMFGHIKDWACCPVRRALGGCFQRLAASWRGATAIGVSAVIAVLSPRPVEAHQWYPKTCCNDQDCFAAERVTRLDDGGLEIRAGPVRVIVPPGFEAQASQDNQVHVCVWRDGMGKYHARCLFLPGIG